MHKAQVLMAGTALAVLLAAPALAETPTPLPQPGPGAAATDRERVLEERVRLLEKRLEDFDRRIEQDEQQRMIGEASAEANSAREAPPEQREFLEGGLALQKLNPEITLTADVMAALVINGRKLYATEEDRSGFSLRGVGLHIQHVLDPYSMFKSAFHVSPRHGFDVEEVYVAWHGLVPQLSFWIGRFRQTFGIVNRWHEHDLDQVEHPLALKLVLGDEGAAGDGFGIRWFMPPLWAHANELTLEVVDGTNETLFSGEHFSVPSGLLHLRSYWDLNPSTYLEFGLTGMVGVNNRVGMLTDDKRLVDEPWRMTYASGADLTLYWSPPSQAKYRSVTWRTEAYHASRQQPDPGGYKHSWGVYSYVQWQPAERWFLGVRGDAVLPTDRANDQIAFDVVPWVTFWQSEFVYLRLEYRHGWQIPYAMPDGNPGRRTDDRVLLQVDFAAGPHKHEKY